MKPIRVSRGKRASRRRAATIVESTVVLGVLLLLLLGMLELTIVLVRHTVMNEAARRVARAVIVHGAEANSVQGKWGVVAVNTKADSSHPAAAVARDALILIDPSEVDLSITWLDGGNEPDQRVRVKTSFTHYPLVPIPNWYSQLDLQGVSTMRIAH